MLEEIKNHPLILLFCADLFFSTQVEAVATKAGYSVKIIASVREISIKEDSGHRQLAEHLEGPGADLIEKVTSWKPMLIIFDLNQPELPWQLWIALLKSVPATRRIPILAFGSHMDINGFRVARDAGAEAVLTTSQLFSTLPQVIEKYAIKIDIKATQEACNGLISPLGQKGIELFNNGKYFEAHEFLEEAWNEDLTPARESYRAILQVAVAYHQIQRGNRSGALKMFLRMRQWFHKLPGNCRGINLAQLFLDAKVVEAVVKDCDPALLHEFDQSLFKPVPLWNT